MATPVMTPGNPEAYKQYQSQLGQILDYKNQYSQGVQTKATDATQGQSMMTNAANAANPIYAQLPTELASYVKTLNSGGLQTFYDSLTASINNSPLGQYQQAVNPFDNEVNNMLGDLKNWKPPVNPFDQAMADLLGQLQTAINTPIADPTSTPQYAAAQARLGRQQADEVNTASEQLGGSGLARSSIVTDRAQGIAQQFTDYMETQIIPQIAQQLMAEKQGNISNIGTLLTATGDQQKTMDFRSSEEYKRLGTLYDAMVGQQGAWDTRIQNQFQNSIAQGNSDLERTKFDHQKTVDKATLELDQINSALQRTQTLGKVSREDAAILGVPAGTLSFQAADAVAKRKHDLEMQKNDAASAMARLNKQLSSDWSIAQARITADKENAKKIAEKQESFEKERMLISIWDQTGQAPPGLESYGIQPGTAKSDSLNPGQLLDQMRLEEAQLLKSEQEARNKNVPAIQAQFKTDKTTADAIYDLYDNPNRESALADFEYSKKALKNEGVDLKKVQEALDDKWPKTSGSSGKSTNPGDLSNAYPLSPLAQGLLGNSTGAGMAAEYVQRKENIDNSSGVDKILGTFLGADDPRYAFLAKMLGY